MLFFLSGVRFDCIWIYDDDDILYWCKYNIFLYQFIYVYVIDVKNYLIL